MKKHNGQAIELVLHPTYAINFCEIDHKHDGKKIIFFAVRDGVKLPKTFELAREEVESHQTRSDFYKNHIKDWEWLAS